MNETAVSTPNELEIRVERVFDAPRGHVFSVWTDPKLIPEWWGDGTVVEEMDVRAGGTYRFKTGFGVETTEERDTTMQYGVEEGARSGFARVDVLLQRLALDA